MNKMKMRRRIEKVEEGEVKKREFVTDENKKKTEKQKFKQR